MVFIGKFSIEGKGTRFPSGLSVPCAINFWSNGCTCGFLPEVEAFQLLSLAVKVLIHVHEYLTIEIWSFFKGCKFMSISLGFSSVWEIISIFQSGESIQILKKFKWKKNPRCVESLHFSPVAKVKYAWARVLDNLNAKVATTSLPSCQDVHTCWL